jgi:glucose-6-phosphate 1-dehydrogenase
MHGDAIRDEQVKVFRTIPPLDIKHLVRGQFKGYKNEKGVAPDSSGEPFSAARLEIQSWHWSGVPFLIRAETASRLRPPRCLSNLGNLLSTVWPASRAIISASVPAQGRFRSASAPE